MFKKVKLRPEDAPTAFQWGECPNCGPLQSNIEWEGEERDHNNVSRSYIQHYYCKNCNCYIDIGQLSQIENHDTSMMSKLDLISRSVKRMFHKKKLKSNYIPLGGPTKTTDPRTMPTVDKLDVCPLCGSDELSFDDLTPEDYYNMDSYIEWVRLADCENCLAGIEQNQELSLEDLSKHEISKLELVDVQGHRASPYIRIKH